MEKSKRRKKRATKTQSKTNDQNYHGHANPRLRQSTDDEATTTQVTNVELDVRLEIQEVGSDEVKMKDTSWNETIILD